MLKRLFFACVFIQLITGNLVSKNPLPSSSDSLRIQGYLDRVENLEDPSVLSIADSLYEMGDIFNDVRLQTVALRAKVDYYYYKNDEVNADSIAIIAKIAMDFAKKKNQTELYYFVWGARLINHYIGMGEYNIALVETEKMLKEAEQEDYKEGVASCYFCMSNIYSAKQLMGKSQEFLLKQIELFEKYHLNIYGISLQYSDVARVYIEEGENEKAAEFLKKAVQYAKNSYHMVTAKQTYIWLYLAEDNIVQATKELEEARQMFVDEPSLKRYIHYFYEVEVDYYRHLKKYDDALRALSSREKELQRKNATALLTGLLKTKADIYWDMGKKEDSAVLYREYFNLQQKEKEKQEEITTGEFATLLNVQKLNIEKAELEQLSRIKQLQNIRIIVILLIFLLCIVFFFLYYQRKLNKKLRKSRDILDEKNRVLLKAEEDLVKAKEMAEESSKMKTRFIQNMSHEIRTPLNSIVGFSSVLTDCFTDENEEVKLYSSVIEENSQLLLKLIGDILDISILDEPEQNIEYRSTNINDVCLVLVEEARPSLSDSVRLEFMPSCDELIVESNLERLSQVLRNLLNNAIKFTNEGEVILAYDVNEENKKLIFTVTDTGIGIPQESQEQVFERFFKQNDFTQGTGLGLSISRIIAEQFGGELFLDKSYSNGSRFVFWIPIR